MENNKNEINTTPDAPVKQKRRHSILSVIITALVITFAGSLLGGILSVIIQITNPDKGKPFEFVMTSYFPFSGLVIILLGYCAIKEKEIFKSMESAGRGGQQGNTFKMLVLGVLLGFASNGFCILIAWLNKDLTFTFGDMSAAFFLFAFGNVLVQSGAEELLSRGYMQWAITERYGYKTAILVNGLFFGLMHIPNEGVTILSVANITIYGTLMSMVTYHFRSLWFCIAHHTAWNFSQSFVFGLPNSGLTVERSVFELAESSQSIWYDVQFGIEGGIVSCIMGIVAVITIYGWSKRIKVKVLTEVNRE